MISQLSRKMIGFESCVLPQTSADRMVEMQTRIAMRKRKTRRGKKKREFGSVEKFPMKSTTDSCDIDCVYYSCQYCTKECLCDQKNKKFSKETRRNRSRQILRPRYSPKAPHNSTQFIMDGHLKDQTFYNHFDSPEYPCETTKMIPELEYSPNSRSSDYGLDTLFRDTEIIDFGTATTDTVAFMEQDFESAMRTAQIDELSNMPKEELLKRVLVMADRAEHLEKELEQSSSDSSHLGDEDDDSMIGSNTKNGRGYLSKLYKENVKLKSENQQLKEMLSKFHN
ncbi:hypothetical protein KP79_PYT11856 [Mizuhopecten yessoensis]|uniref:Uncharacterized protein n=1 Tax=Mizuhopecten yessoensis TaxID=6573 RepID=A0A210PYP8_MIZYE|nr:hypothetical protein KP79_PYT11856 [Mizuhopecten yessoensis]